MRIIAKVKEGFKRKCADVPEEWIKIINEYNKSTTRPVNIAAVIRKAIESEVNRIKTEMVK
jgi:hypothetical protein